MNVYVCTHGDYDDKSAVEVFASLRAARRKHAGLVRWSPADAWWDNDEYGDSRVTVYRMRVQE